VHKEHVRAEITSLKKAALDHQPQKCEFHMGEVKYLRLIVRVNTMRIDPEKVQAVENWEAPKRFEEFQAFLDIANFYKRFIGNYSKVVQLLTTYAKKLVPFDWGLDQKMAFGELKNAFITAPVSAHVNF
jgi:hypothetical protein